MKAFTDDLPPIIDACTMAVRQICVKGANDLWHEKKSLNILDNLQLLGMYNERPAVGTIKDENALKLEEHISKIMNAMLENCKEQIFGRPLLIFLGKINTNGDF